MKIKLPKTGLSFNKSSIALLYIMFLLNPGFCFSQKEKDKNTLSFMDNIQKVIDMRKSFETENETKKPALFSFKKDEGEKAVFVTDIALSLKIFRFDDYGISPFVQFDYSSKSKEETEKITVGISSYYKLYEYSGGSGKIESLVSFSKDFDTEIENVIFRLSYTPRFPNFFIPVRNVNDVTFKYDKSKKDNVWVFGFNPFMGLNFDRKYGGKKNINRTLYFTSTGGNLTLKKYYLQLDLYGIYEFEFDDNTNSKYKYEATATFYFDERERASLNAKYLQELKEKELLKRITFGFGIKL